MPIKGPAFQIIINYIFKLHKIKYRRLLGVFLHSWNTDWVNVTDDLPEPNDRPWSIPKNELLNVGADTGLFQQVYDADGDSRDGRYASCWLHALKRILCKMNNSHFAHMLIATACAFISIQCATAKEPTSSPASETILFQKSLGEGRELCIKRGSDYSAADLATMELTQQNKNMKSAFPLRVEFQFSNGRKCMLGERVIFDPENPQESGFDVLNASMENGSVVVAVGHFANIEIWRINFLGSSQSFRLPTTWWSSMAALMPVDRKRVAVKIKSNASGLIVCEVNNINSSDKKIAHIVQKNTSEWSFEPITEVGEKKPPVVIP